MMSSSFLKQVKIESKQKGEPVSIPIIVQARDRELDDEENRALKCAQIINIEDNRLIKPIVGRLGFYFRNIDNDEVVEILRIGLRRRGVERRYENIDKVRILVTKFVEYHGKLDEYSKKRVDVFDYICIVLDIEPLDIWEVFKSEAKHHSDELTKVDIETYKPIVVRAIARKALKDSDNESKALFARISGLDKGNTTIIDNSVRNTQVNENTNLFSNFSSSIRRTEREFDSVENEQKQLEGGEIEFVEAEIINEEKEKVA